MTDQTPDETVRVLAEVQWAHIGYGDEETGITECKCGEKVPALCWEEDFGDLRWHHQHVATAQAAALPQPDAATVLREAADQWTAWETFPDTDGHKSIRQHGMSPADWLRRRADALASSASDDQAGVQG